jgi:DNA-binding MarR family transcriptional regulator
MNNSLQDHFFKPSGRMRDLQLLEEIEQNPRISQRELSNKFGIALGVTNACIKRMARRGLIRLKGFPPRRIAYYLTPKGFTEKSKLMLHFFSYNIQHYAEMKKLISKKLLEIQSSRIKRVAFYADGTFLEMPESWEKEEEGIGQKEAKIVLIATCATEQDCPSFLTNWSGAGFLLLQEVNEKRKGCSIQIYQV